MWFQLIRTVLFDCLQALAMFFASLCHDLDHRGRTNSWMKNEQTPLAAVYSTSTMEHHHFNQTITILQVRLPLQVFSQKRNE